MNTQTAVFYSSRRIQRIGTTVFVTLMTTIVLAGSAFAQDPSLDTCPAESVPSMSVAGFVAMTLAVLAAGIMSPRWRPSRVSAALLFAFAVIGGTLLPLAPAQAVDAMSAVRCCTVTLRLLSFSVQEGSGDSPIDDRWHISTRSEDVSQPEGQGVSGGALAAGMSKEFAPAPVIGKPTRQLFWPVDPDATVFQRSLKLSSSVTEVDMGGGQPYDFNEWSGFIPNTMDVLCPSTGTTTTVSAHGEGSDAIEIPVPVSPGETVPFPSRTNFDVTVTYSWTATRP